MKPEEHAHRPNKWSSTYERDTLTFMANMDSSCDGQSHGCCVTAHVSKCLGEVEKKRKKELGRTKLLTFQIMFSPANGRLTSRVSAGAGN